MLKPSGNANNISYAFDLELFSDVIKEESKWTLNTRNIFLKIKKKTSGPFWNYLTKDKKKHNFIGVDWMLYCEEDEEEEAKTPDFGNMGGSKVYN